MFRFWICGVETSHSLRQLFRPLVFPSRPYCTSYLIISWMPTSCRQKQCSAEAVRRSLLPGADPNLDEIESLFAPLYLGGPESTDLRVSERRFRLQRRCRDHDVRGRHEEALSSVMVHMLHRFAKPCNTRRRFWRCRHPTLARKHDGIQNSSKSYILRFCRFSVDISGICMDYSVWTIVTASSLQALRRESIVPLVPFHVSPTQSV